MTDKKMGRPLLYAGATKLQLKPRADAPRLQKDSERRHIIDFLLEPQNAGTCTLDEAAAKFGRQRVLALVRAGWLRIVKEERA